MGLKGKAERREGRDVDRGKNMGAKRCSFFHRFASIFLPFGSGSAKLESQISNPKSQAYIWLPLNRSLATFRAESRFGTWLASIALNEARSILRRRNQFPSDSLDDNDNDHPAAELLLLLLLLLDWF